MEPPITLSMSSPESNLSLSPKTILSFESGKTDLIFSTS